MKKTNKKTEDATEKAIRTDLLDQLSDSGRFGSFYEDLVEDYISYYRIKKDLIEDISSNGLRITVMTGNGFEKEVENKSVVNLPKITQMMLRILNDLKLEAPKAEEKKVSEDDYM